MPGRPAAWLETIDAPRINVLAMTPYNARAGDANREPIMRYFSQRQEFGRQGMLLAFAFPVLRQNRRLDLLSLEILGI
jgi:hypothetical protein